MEYLEWNYSSCLVNSFLNIQFYILNYVLLYENYDF